MDRQEIFDTVATHLIAQGEKCEDEGRCQYRGTGDLKCAIGILIPNNLYHVGMEESGITYLIHSYPEVKKLLGADDRDTALLLSDLQTVHDTNHPVEWPERLKAVAEEHNLEYNQA